MITLTILVGLPCSGKSTWAKSQVDSIIFESDKYREYFYGDASIQSDNHKLFEAIHNDIIKCLQDGRNVIFDATNLSQKHRRALLDKVKKLNVHKICILFATEYDICLERNRNRKRQVPEEVIKRMRENFNVPMYEEGFDRIEILYEYNKEYYSIEKYLEIVDEFNQENTHHSMTLGQHSRKVVEYMVEENHLDEHILLAGLLHDCGKPATKVFRNMKGDVTEVAHYYNHENLGAYEILFYLEDRLTRTRDILFASALVNFHMRMYNLKTEKSRNKLLKTVGEDLFYFLEILNMADSKAH